MELGQAEPRAMRGSVPVAPRALHGDGPAPRPVTVTLEHTPGPQAREAATLVALAHRLDAVTEVPAGDLERVTLLLDGRSVATTSWSTGGDRPGSWPEAVASAVGRAIEADGRFGGAFRPVGHPTGPTRPSTSSEVNGNLTGGDPGAGAEMSDSDESDDTATTDDGGK